MIMEEPEKNSNSFKKLRTKYMLSVMAACVAEFVTYPLDLTKTRLQIQGKITLILVIITYILVLSIIRYTIILNIKDTQDHYHSSTVELMSFIAIKISFLTGFTVNGTLFTHQFEGSICTHFF